MRTLHFVRTTALWAAIGATGVVVAVMAVPLLFDARPLTVLSGSMEPAVGTGDVVIARGISPLDARVGDVVTFRDPRSGRLMTHRVRSMSARGRRVDFVTKGDANNATERWSVARGDQVSRSTLRLPELGHGLAVARSHLGFVGLVVAPLLLLALVELASIWRPDARKAEGDAPA